MNPLYTEKEALSQDEDNEVLESNIVEGEEIIRYQLINDIIKHSQQEYKKDTPVIELKQIQEQDYVKENIVATDQNDVNLNIDNLQSEHENKLDHNEKNEQEVAQVEPAEDDDSEKINSSEEKQELNFLKPADESPHQQVSEKEDQKEKDPQDDQNEQEHVVLTDFNNKELIQVEVENLKESIKLDKFEHLDSNKDQVLSENIKSSKADV